MLKHSRPNFRIKPITYRAFPEMPDLCPVRSIQEYLKFRLSRSSDPQFFITTTKPFKGASKATIARWVKQCMFQAGIDISKFSPHSCRASSTSFASWAGIDLLTIMKSASWSRESTFKRHYQREIDISYDIQDNFGSKLLSVIYKK